MAALQRSEAELAALRSQVQLMTPRAEVLALQSRYEARIDELETRLAAAERELVDDGVSGGRYVRGTAWREVCTYLTAQQPSPRHAFHLPAAVPAASVAAALQLGSDSQLPHLLGRLSVLPTS